MSDRVIPAAAAKAAAQLLRAHKDDVPDDTRFSPLSLADMLDPPCLPTLHAEVVTALQAGLGKTWEAHADLILAVVRRRVALIQTPVAMRGDGWTDAINRDDVLRLLGGTE